MYIDNENFEKWMEKLSKKLTEIGQDLKSLINTDTVFDENEWLFITWKQRLSAEVQDDLLLRLLHI